MDAQSYTAQERRAANQVWAAAGAYGFEPLFLARNTDGTIDFYMNCIVGLVHKYYGDALIRDIFSAWEGDVRQPMLDDMAWLYLENAAYRLELPRRPVLEALRFAHADYFFAIQYKLSRQEWMAKNQLVYTMQAARWRKVLGHTAPVMTPYESSLAAALEPEAVPEPAQLKNDLLVLFAKFALFDGKVRQKPALHLRLQGFWAKLATKTMPTQMIKTDRVTVEHSGAVDATGSGLAVDKRRANITLKQRAAQDRAYIESCFGHCFYPPEQLRKAEQELCTGVHLGCHLWFSAGVPSPAQAPTPEARQLAQQAELQAERNRAYYAKNQELHRSVVLRLTEQIRNCILVHQQPDQRIARSGDLCAGRVWRAPYLNDDRVFLCPEEENCPAFTVDLLLDASASRLHCQEVIAAQGVILAESLANCGIPVRVSAFSSLRGYTVLRVLKSFTDKNRQNIFRYFASGWNRDGLALRAAGDLIRYAPGPAPRHLMILLTDASPNDSRRIPPTTENPLGCAYEDAAGVADTAAQVRTLQRQGVREENCPAFTVDLLLDASASRLHCQEVIAAQGVILAESLANCGIPVRVSAFSSLRGYTVLRVLKSFTDKNRQNIFRYFASGWNRDGLALRAAGDLIRYAPGPAPRHLMILLTDASPNDSRRIPPTTENPLGCAYEDAAGVADTAAQVRTLQRQGVRVSAVFMGEDSSAGAAAQIYGKNMARIRGMDQLARAAGRLIQNEIRELGD